MFEGGMRQKTRKNLEFAPVHGRFSWKLRSLIGKIPPRISLLLSLPTHSVGAEIGVHKGDFSDAILNVTQPKKLFLIDPWMYETDETYGAALYGGEKGQNQSHMDDRYNSVLARFSTKIETENVCVIRDISENALGAMDNNSLDFVYIDGNHLYEYAKNDLELSFLKVRPGGIISGDDYTLGQWWEGGVKKAVDEFVKDKKLSTLKIFGDQFLVTKPKHSNNNRH